MCRSRKGNIPHASKQLDETTVTESKTDDNVGLGDVTSAHVDSRKDESGQGESRQAQRSRVGELAALDRLVQTRLELTTERRQASFRGVDMGQRTIAKTSRSASDILLLSGHDGSRGRTGSTAVGALGGVSNVLFDGRVVLSGHFEEFVKRVSVFFLFLGFWRRFSKSL